MFKKRRKVDQRLTGAKQVDEQLQKVTHYLLIVTGSLLVVCSL